MAHLPYWAGEGGWDLYQHSSDLLAVVTRCNFTLTHSEEVPSEGLVEFHLSLNGEVQLGEHGKATAIRDVTLLICQQGLGSSYTVCCPPGLRLGVSLYARPRFLVEALDVADLADFTGADPHGEVIVGHRVPLPIQAAELLEQLLGNPFTGRRRLFFAKSVLMQLLCVCSRAWERRPRNASHEVFTRRDLELFERARRRIIETVHTPITIAALARELGTNPTKLKRGFKMLYGTTLFELGSHHRLNEALRLLAAGRLSVSQVSQRVGYRHQASFACAFKRQFGINPKDARRLG